MNSNFSSDGAAASRASKRQCTTFDGLMTFFDQPFVEVAFETLLLREADPIGRSYYTQRLRFGHSRVSVLDQMVRSSEIRDDWAEIEGLPEALSRFQGAKRLAGWKWALFHPEFGRTPAIRRARTLQNSIGADRQILEQSVERLIARHIVLEQMIGGLTEQGLLKSTPSRSSESHISVVDLRPRSIQEAREHDLPKTGRAALSQFRF